VLKDSNNTIVHLAPSSIVAKVGTSTIHPGVERLERELEVGRHLAAAGAPIAPPSDVIPPGPHRHDGLALTFWRFCEHRAAEDRDATAAGLALRQLHRDLADYAGVLPSFREHFREAGTLLAEADVALRAADRVFLRETYERLDERLVAPEINLRPLHGGPHLGNVLVASDGVRFVDFEAACAGPPEWDAGFLPPAGAALLGPLDQGLMSMLDIVRSFCVAVWCWAQPERAPEVAEAAHVHLRLLRQALES
jgi:predicted trehalose synthase